MNEWMNEAVSPTGRFWKRAVCKKATYTLLKGVDPFHKSEHDLEE